MTHEEELIRLNEELDATYQDIEELNWIVMQYERDTDFESEMSYENTMHELNGAENLAMYLEVCLRDYE